MVLTNIRNSLIAGFCGALAHSLLTLVHRKTGPLPEFQPNEDIRRIVSALLHTEIHPGIAWLLLFVNGAVIWGFVFGQAYRFLPGNSPWQKGGFFAVCAWAVMGFVFFPLVGRGVFAVQLGLGIGPAVLMLLMFLTFSLTMSYVYHLLNRHMH